MVVLDNLVVSPFILLVARSREFDTWWDRYYFCFGFRGRKCGERWVIEKTKYIDTWCSSIPCRPSVFSSHLFWTSSLLDVPAGVTQDFSSTFLLRCVPSFFSREEFSHSFPSSTVKTKLVYQVLYNDLIVLHSLGINIFIIFIF